MINLFRFLTYVLEDPFSKPGFNNATEHVSVNESDCIEIVRESMEKSDEQGGLRYNEPQLLVHKRLWDVVTRDKEGRDKEYFFADYCRRVASHAKKSSTATENAREKG